MSRETLRNGIVYSMQMNHGTIDSSGQNTAGTNNGATPQQVHNGTGAYSFDGSNDRVLLGTSINPTNMENCSLIAWVKLSSIPDGTINQHRTIFGQGNGYSSYYSYPLWLTVSTHTKKFQLQRYGTNINSITEPEVNTWYHVAFVLSGTTGKIYVNGNLETTGTIGAAGGTNYNLSIGALGNMTDFNGGSWDGLIDEASIYNAALSQEIITSLYNKGKGKQYSELTSTEKTNLVSYYGFNGNANDEHGSNNGTVNGATLQQAKLGTGAYSFDGVNDYITTPINSGFTNQQTISLWIKASSTVSNFAGIVTSRGTSGQFAGIDFLENGQISYYIRGTKRIESTGVNLKDNEWHLITATYNGTKMVLYVDGIYNNELSTTEIIETADYYKIGWDDAFSARYYNGIIDDVNIWNRGLNLAEATELYNSGDGLELFPGLADGVISAYKFDGDSCDDERGNFDLVNTSSTNSSDGIINECRSFTTGQYLTSSTSMNSLLYGATKFTINSWFKLISPYDISTIIMERNSSTIHLGLLYLTTDSKLYGYAGTESITSVNTISSNVFHMATLVYDGGNIKLYVDAELDNTSAYSTALPNIIDSRLRIGRNYNLAQQDMDGLIDETTIWNRGLSSDEITYLYNDGGGLQYDFIIEEVSGYLIKRYNGTSWEEYPVKVYNGTDWIDAKVKRYNGSEWVEL